MDAQTIAQVKAADPESLWHFLQALPATMEAQLFYGLMLAGTLGMIANYIVRWARKEIEGSLLAYLMEQNPRGTVLSLCTYTGVAIGAIAATAFTIGPGNTFVGWGWVLWMGATNGFMIDNITNKGQRAEWTPEQRAARG
jgi:hypothetical protein